MAALVITPEIEAAAQQLAEATGTTPTEALVEALRREVATLPRRIPDESVEDRVIRLREADETLRQLHALVVDRGRTEDEILGYDQYGVPEQPYLGR